MTPAVLRMTTRIEDRVASEKDQSGPEPAQTREAFPGLRIIAKRMKWRGLRNSEQKLKSERSVRAGVLDAQRARHGAACSWNRG